MAEMKPRPNLSSSPPVSRTIPPSIPVLGASWATDWGSVIGSPPSVTSNPKPILSIEENLDYLMRDLNWLEAYVIAKGGETHGKALQKIDGLRRIRNEILTTLSGKMK